jgi:hypothetical protein
MAEYVLLMHDDAIADEGLWEPYIRRLQHAGCFEGGSAIGDGMCARKSGPPARISAHLTGYIRVQAENLEEAISLLAGNPHFEAGGTVEVRELPRSAH